MAAAAKTVAIVRSNRWGSVDQRNMVAWKGGNLAPNAAYDERER